MDEWQRVKWTDSNQIFEALEEAPPETVRVADPHLQFDALIAAGHLYLAVRFLALALPRYESIVWAARAIRGPNAPPPSSGGANAMAAIDRWIRDPDEPHRRAVWTAGQAAEENTPERLTAMATFLSGGSIAPEDLQPVQPDANLCARLSAAAVLAQAYRTDDPAAFLRVALDSGAKIAAEGVR